MKCGVGVLYKESFSLNKCEFRENQHFRCGDMIVRAGFVGDKVGVRRDAILRRRVRSFNSIYFHSVRYRTADA
jgi:hypothetical protein